MDEEKENLTGEMVTENIRLCPDGAYRWTYEFDMLRNPTILLTLWKVLGIAFGAVFLFVLLDELIRGAVGSWEKLWGTLKVFLILAAVFFVLSLLSYVILAAIYGWKYQVLFEMTEEQLHHIQMEKQFKKAEAVGWITVAMGLAQGKPSMVGLGLDAAVRDMRTSELKKVQRLRVCRRRHTIYVDQGMNKNQVYAGEGDFDFVERFLKERCVNAKFK